VSIGEREAVLVVDDQEPVRRMIARLLEGEGFRVLEAGDGGEAVALFEAHSPLAVISDVMMPGMDGLELLRRVKRIDRNAAVILMTGLGTSEVLLAALRGGATNFFKKPFNVHDLVQEVRSVAEFRREAARAALYTPYLEEETKRFRIPSGTQRYFPVINQVALQLPLLLPVDEALTVKVGIEEMIQNAIEHGNLGIGCDEKAAALRDGTWADLVAERLRAGGASRVVTVESHLSRERFVVTVTDEGEGFDWRSLPGLDAQSLLTFSGRGIFLTRIYFDEVRYNDRGNEVTLVKKRSLSSPAAG
jgi:CheY-like chemotaxis protein/anti-sigma regulatory factor (Ser/Thr protein kinase)